MDHAIVSALNGFAWSSAWTAGLSIFLASHLILAMASALIAFWLLDREKRSLAAVSAVVSAALAWAAAHGIGLIYFRPRPFAEHADIMEIIARSPLEKSMPSEHAATAFALAMSLTLVNRRWGAWFFAAAALVALGRILVGVHYPSDTLVGAMLGCAVAYAVHRLLHIFLHTRHRPI